ncbi:hypothetical protein NFI96_007035 [Prochilodus magdalenae]|nr:hypothetical protein NFI96_007035 [Prochilodus magdalenae]
MDRRMLLLLYMDEGLMDALMKLDAVQKEKQELDKRIQELTTRSTNQSKSKTSLSDLLKEEAALQEEENQLKLQRERLTEALEGAQRNLQKGQRPVGQRPVVQCPVVQCPVGQCPVVQCPVVQCLMVQGWCGAVSCVRQVSCVAASCGAAVLWS